MRVYSLVALTTLMATRMATAWSINGHMIVSGIAEKVLEEKAPGALADAKKMLKIFADFDKKEETIHEGDHPFVETATFADDTKYHGEMWQSDFHFEDVAFIDEGKESDYDIKVKPHNLTSGMGDIVGWLSGKKGAGYKKGYMYTFLMKKFENNEDVAKSFALRLLVHYMGDLVQPFHNISRFTKANPEGDKGANAFLLPNHYGASELHAVWDFVLYEEHNNIPRPFTKDSWDTFSQHLDGIMKDYGYAVSGSSIYKSTNYSKWSTESYELAKTLYDGVTENEPVPQAYLDKNIKIAYERLIIGGYRLYYTMTYIFGDSLSAEYESTLADFTDMIVANIDVNAPKKFLQ